MSRFGRYPSLGKPAVGKNIELPAFDELGVPLRWGARVPVVIDQGRVGLNGA